MTLADYRTAMPRGTDFPQNLLLSSSRELAVRGRLWNTNAYHHCASGHLLRLGEVVYEETGCYPVYPDLSNKLIPQMLFETAPQSSKHLPAEELQKPRCDTPYTALHCR